MNNTESTNSAPFKTALVYIFGTGLLCLGIFVLGIAVGNIKVDWHPGQLDITKLSHKERVQLASQLAMGEGE